MPHDPERIAETGSWFAKASVEKSIKGFLSWHDRTFGKTHNLVEIGESAAAVDSTLETLLTRLPSDVKP